METLSSITSRSERWIKQRIESYEYVLGIDYTLTKFVKRGTTLIDYYISVDMAKQLAMVENNEKGREIRRYFIECGTDMQI